MAAGLREEVLKKLEGMDSKVPSNSSPVKRQVSQTKQNINYSAVEASNDIGFNSSAWGPLSEDDIKLLIKHVAIIEADKVDKGENETTAQSAAISKVKAMKYYIAHHNALLDDNLMEQYYDGLELQSDSLLHSVLNIRKFNKGHEMNKLRKVVNRSDWEIGSMMAIEADAVYSSHLNSFCEFPSVSFMQFKKFSVFIVFCFFSFRFITCYFPRSFFLGRSVSCSTEKNNRFED